MYARTGLIAIVLSLGLGVGCAAADSMQDKLYDATRAYNRALRWGDFDRASAYLPTASTDAFLDQHDRVDDELVILDYRMTRLKLNKDKGTAAARFEIDWHTDRRLIVEQTVVDEMWQWYEGAWYLVDERRADGKPLAIFAEGEFTDGEHPYLPGIEKFRDELDIGRTPVEKRRRNKLRKASGKPSNEEPEFGHLNPERAPPSFY